MRTIAWETPTLDGQAANSPRQAAAREDVAPVRARARRAGLALLAVLALGGALAYGWHWWSTGRFLERTDDAYVGGDITVIASKVPGYIGSVLVEDNQFVRAGAVLVKLDDRDYQAALARAEAAVESQRAQVANLAATARLQQAVIAQADAGIGAAAAETARAGEAQQRYQRLVAKAAVSVDSAQRADAEFKEALANDRKAQATVEAARRAIEVIAAQQRQAQAALAQAIAERDLARLNVEYTQLRAPIDGVVGNRRARVGAYAAGGAQLLAIVPARGLWVDANFKEDQVAGLRAGQAATVVADAAPGRRYHGHVASLAPATGAQFSVLPTENATGNFTKIVQRVPVRIVLDGDDGALGALRPGLSVVATVDARSGGDARP
jgi:membrane fusion protein (multidrug efflux system)